METPRDLEAELAKAQASLAEARLKTEGFAGLSHEIRTLLNGVIGYTGLLLDTDLAGEQRDYVKRIRSSGDALLALLNNVLDYSKIDAQKLELERVDFDPRRAIEEVTDLLAERASSKGLELVIDVHAAMLPVLRGDPARLRQVVVNFVSNAIKFTEKGEVVVRAILAGETDTTARLRVEVRDTGAGISAEGQARLFEPFTQVDDGAQQGGTGLGLALSRRLVTAMSGTIGATSELGRGSTFFCEIPMEKRPIAPRRAIPRIDFAGRHALLVTQNATLRDVVRGMIEELEIECLAVPSADLAIQAAETAMKPFDVAVVDKTAPGQASLAAKLAESPRGARVRLVLLAYPGQRSPSDRESSAAQLAKPVRRGHLHAVLRTLMGQDLEQATLNPASRKKLPQTQSDLVEVRRASRALAAVREKDTRREAPERERPRALIVEDNVVNQRVAIVLLEKRGFKVDAAGGGREAVALALANRYALVLMDCHMPGLDGYAATGEIRAREVHDRHTPIVAMTAHAGPGAREKCLEAGMDDYLSKPVMADELDRVVKTWARVESARADVPRPRRKSTGPKAAASASAESPRASRTSERERSAVPASRAERVPPPLSSSRVDEAAPSGRPTLDYRALGRLRELEQPDGPDIVAEVVALFQDDAMPRIQAMRKAAEEDNPKDLMRIAHTLKGSAANVGAASLAELCGTLEDALKKSDQVDWEASIRAIHAELDRANAALTAYVDQEDE